MECAISPNIKALLLSTDVLFTDIFVYVNAWGDQLTIPFIRMLEKRDFFLKKNKSAHLIEILKMYGP